MNWSGGANKLAARRLPWSLCGLGCALLVLLTVETAVVATGSQLAQDSVTFVIGVLTSAPFAAGIGFGGYWLHTAGLGASRYPRIGKWVAAGLVAFLAIILAVAASMPSVGGLEVVSWIRWAVSIGAGVGLLIGVTEARTIERTLAAERDALRAEHLERQRDILDYLNSILRHEVLNAATVIEGYASNLLEADDELDERHRRWAEIVVSESDDMTEVIEDVRVLLQATDGDLAFQRMELTDILDHEVRKLRHEYDDVEVALDAPKSVAVRADGLLPRVFGNLLSNAVEHDDAETPSVEVRITPGEEFARVEVEDNGPGIPDAERPQLFERTESRGSSHGLGLYLVAQLVDRYDGRVEVTETGPDGSLFTVELPRDGPSAEEGPAGATVAPPSLSAD